jgi:adenine deaminase
MRVEGQIVDLFQRRVYPGFVEFEDGQITDVQADDAVSTTSYIMPGFVDAHVHVESSLLVPSEFARLAVRHGTVGTVSDPHEIANVCGMDGIRFMLENAERVPFHFAFGAPSCVPATTFETAGAEISANDIKELFQDERIRYLSEMMNWPGVLYNDPVVLEKLAIAHAAGRPVDGHAPGLKGADARLYASRGITTDHECFTLEEATDKIDAGMKILIREGSAAKNYDALHTLLRTAPEQVMFCCDDAHPDLLVEGHIDRHVRKSIAHGYDIFDVLRAASVNPIEHYNLPVGLLRVGDGADFILVDDLERFTIEQTWIKGQLVAERGAALIDSVPVEPINQFDRDWVTMDDLHVEIADKTLRIIVAHDGQLITTEVHGRATDPDVLKLVVVNRYTNAAPTIAAIRGFGLTHGALASSVAHDSHNIVAVGTNDRELVRAINAVSADERTDVLPLPVGGLMSAEDAFTVARQYSKLNQRALDVGTTLKAPFMTLSFMALLVIPQLKLSDKGLFDGEKFEFVDLVVGDR